MRKQVEESTAAESARRATRPAAERDRKGRFSARRKRATVLRLLRGENLESVSRELGITAARASQWRDQFLAAGQAGRPPRKSCWPATGKPPAWSLTTRRARPPNAGPSHGICKGGDGGTARQQYGIKRASLRDEIPAVG